MGSIWHGAPKNIVLWMKEAYGLNTFIETGTYAGNTAVWASKYFKKVYTIEASKTIYSDTRKRHKNIVNIKFILGKSEKEIKKIIGNENLHKDKPLLFWLDAHFSSGGTYGKSNECPLKNEIKAINLYKNKSYIIIDDARLFLSPPYKPYDVNQWPNIKEIIDLLSKKNRHTIIFQDVIISVPRGKDEKNLIRWIQDENTKEWLNTQNMIDIQSKKHIITIFEVISTIKKYFYQKIKRDEN